MANRSEAQKKADKKYHAKTYKTFSVNPKIAENDIIESYCKEHNMSKSAFAIKSMFYVIENDIDLKKK